nr:hypothetical protein [uncultured Brevundimonas sp.]
MMKTEWLEARTQGSAGAAGRGSLATVGDRDKRVVFQPTDVG